MTKKTSLKDALANIKKVAGEAQAEADKASAEERRKQAERDKYEGKVAVCVDTIVRPLLEQTLTNLIESDLDPKYEQEPPPFGIGESHVEPLIGLRFRHPRDKHVNEQSNRTAQLLFVWIKRKRDPEQFGFFATPNAKSGARAATEEGYLSTVHWLEMITADNAEEALGEVLDCLVKGAVKGTAKRR